MLSGYRTYIAAAAIGVLAAIYALGYINQEQFDFWWKVIMGGGLAALRAGVASAGK